MKIMTVTEGANIIQDAAEDWSGNGSIYTVIWKTAGKLSKDPAFNLAAYFKYNLGPCLSGEEDGDWLEEAREIIRFLGK